LQKKITDKLGGGKDAIRDLEKFIHISISMKNFIPFTAKVLARYEKSFCPFDDRKRKHILNA